MWTVKVEWTIEFCVEQMAPFDTTISHCVLDSFVPFYSVWPPKSLHCCMYLLYASVDAYLSEHVTFEPYDFEEDAWI